MIRYLFGKRRTTSSTRPPAVSSISCVLAPADFSKLLRSFGLNLLLQRDGRLLAGRLCRIARGFGLIAFAGFGVAGNVAFPGHPYRTCR